MCRLATRGAIRWLSNLIWARRGRPVRPNPESGYARSAPGAAARRAAGGGGTLNKVIIIGNLGRDPEMRYSPSGNPMTSFSVATNRRYTGPNGEQRDQTEWFNCTASGRLADTCNQYLARGRQVYIEGRLSTRQYDRRDGTPGFSLDVFVTEVQFLGRRDEQPGGDGGGYGDEQRGGGYDNRPADGGYGNQRGGYDNRPAGGGGYGGGAPGDNMDVDDLPF